MLPGTVIFINGCSSSGKTSLVKALQKALPEIFLDAGLDRFLWMLPRRCFDRPLWDDVLGLADRAGETGHRLVLGMHAAVEALSLAGLCVAADHVLVEPAWAADLARRFAPLPAYLVAVDLPLDVLEQRESSRGDRTLGQAKTQFPVIHRFCQYDLRVNTAVDSPEACAAQVIAYIQNCPPAALRQMRSTLAAR